MMIPPRISGRAGRVARDPRWGEAELLLAGNLGGVVLVLVVQAALGNPYVVLVVMSAIVMPGLLLAARLPRRARTHMEDDRRHSEELPA